MNDVLWSPGEERREATALKEFRRLAEEACGRSFPDYEALWRWSIDDRASFWSLVWAFAGVRASRTWETVLENGDAMPGARWFTGARLNYAENLLRKRDDTMAIVCRGEGGRRRAMTFAELHDAVAATRAWLARQGVGRGDRVAGYLPNLPETIVAKLATASLGAVWSSSSPDFGTRGVLDRFGQIDPKVLITADGYVYGGRHFDSRPRVAEILDAMPGIGHVVVIPWVDQDCDTGDLRDAVTWKEVMATPRDGIDFEQVPFDHPLAILYSSGTTGAPKCIVHGHGGTLLQHLKEHRLHCDIRHGDRLFYFSTCGWMMWNWQVSALASGATLAIYEGHPASPDGNCPVGLLPGGEVHRIRRLGKVLRGHREGGNPAGPESRSRGSPPRSLHGLAPGARELRLHLSRREGGCSAGVDLRWNRYRLLLRSRQPRERRAPRGNPVARSRHGRRHLR